ncbi:hypothetical protein [Oleiphilus messinensis]|uniref:hypothetical protein n=1 Tax=Oleiphilus messinensis TaxID=141451 RepID=UPI0018DF75BE|nr:hypothetical protein [Oleiphilus messinensis]
MGAGLKESERQYYLKQMGVSAWYARTPLAGAKSFSSLDFNESERLPIKGHTKAKTDNDSAHPIRGPKSNASARVALQAVNPQGQESESSSSVSAKDTPASSSALSLLASNNEGADRVVESVKTVLSKPVPDASPSEGEARSLSIEVDLFRVDNVGIISEAVPAHLEEVARKLILNVVQAFVWPDKLQCSVEHHQWGWPPFNNLALPDQDDAVARKIFRQLCSQFLGGEVRYIFVLGGSLSSFLAGNNVPVIDDLFVEVGHGAGEVSNESGDRTCKIQVASFTLGDCIQAPAIKRELHALIQSRPRS